MGKNMDDMFRRMADGAIGRERRREDGEADRTGIVREYIEKHLVPADIASVEDRLFRSPEAEEAMKKARGEYEALVETPGAEELAALVAKNVHNGEAVPFDMNPAQMRWYLSMAGALKSSEGQEAPYMFENPVLDFWKSMACPAETPYTKMPTYTDMVILYLLSSSRGEMPLVKRLDVERERPVMARLFNESSSWLFFRFFTPEERMDEEFDILDTLKDHSLNLFYKRIASVPALKDLVEQHGASEEDMKSGIYNEWRGQYHCGISCSCCGEEPPSGDKTLVLRTTQGGASGREETYCGECMDAGLEKARLFVSKGTLLIDEEELERERYNDIIR